jgi:hypothetical protein
MPLSSNVHMLTFLPLLLLLLLLLVVRAETVAGIPAKKAVVTDAAGGKAEVVAPNVHISKVCYCVTGLLSNTLYDKP